MPPVSERPSTDPPPATRLPALARPGMVFAELVGADALVGDRLVAGVLRGVSPKACRPAEEPAQAVRFWRGLVRALGRQGPAAPAMSGPFLRLAEVAPGRRALWLLARLSALDPVALAAILDLPPARIRASLVKVEMALGPALPDCLAALRNRQAALSAGRMARVADWHASGPASGREDMPHWRAAVAGAVGLVTLAGFLWTFDGLGPGSGDPDIRTRPLIQEGEPQRYDGAAAIRLHPDRRLLTMPENEAAVARDAAFYAWFAAERERRSDDRPAVPAADVPEDSAPGEADAN